MKTIEFESAQNVKIEYELASVGTRAAAAMIDFLMFVIYFIIVGMVIGFTGWFEEDMGSFLFLQLLVMKLPWIFYNPIMEYLTQGLIQTKSPLNIQRVKISRRPGRSPEIVTTRIPNIYLPRLCPCVRYSIIGL